MAVWVGGTVLAVGAVFVLARMAGRASRPEELALSAQHGGGDPASVDDAAARVDPPAADPSRDVPREGDPSGGLESGSASTLDGVAGMRYALCVGAWPGGETGEQQARGLIAELDREGFPQVQGLVLQPSGEIRVFVGQAREATDPALESLRERAIRFLRDTVLSDPATVRIEVLPTVVR